MATVWLGMLAILLALHGVLPAAAACVVAGTGIDALGGLLARCLDVSSPFGAQLDSLAEMCAFGIAAPVVFYVSSAGNGWSPAVAAVCALVGASAAVRLGRFNVTPKDGWFYTGLPTTMVAATLALAVLVEPRVPHHAALAGAVLLAFAMVSRLPYPTPACLLRMPWWCWLFPAAGVLLSLRLTFLLMVASYLAVGPLAKLSRKARRLPVNRTSKQR